ncbi:MAG TPA: hydantoinase/oxoprolinase family protein, partial [Planctomycetota bacterium]|nr:hydantoinase/oxoprolinase family protein [Planctomycetota bacterium]
LRYVGQNFELLVPVPEETWMTGDCTALRRRFLDAHEQVYGFAAEDEAVQVVNARLVARGLAEPPRLPPVPRGDGDPHAARVGRRDVYVDDERRVVSCPVYDRARLLAGQRVIGPGVIEQFDATSFVLAGQAALVDDLGFLVIEGGSAE